MRRRTSRLLLLLLAATVVRGERLPIASIAVTGAPARARAMAEEASQQWRRENVGSIESLIASVGERLIREGYGEGTIEADVDTLDGRLSVSLLLSNLIPTRLGAWIWESEEESSPGLEPGAWLPAERESQIWTRLGEIQEQGHPFASIQVLSVRSEPEGLVVRARLRQGPKYLLSGVRFEGQGGTRPAYLERVCGLQRGVPISPRAGREARERLERTGLFAEVEGPWLRTAGDGRATLLYRMKSFPQNRAEGAVGYDGKSRTLAGTINVDLGNLFGTGRSMHVAWERVDADRSRLDLAYREPYLVGLPISAELRLFQVLEDSTWTEDEFRGLLESSFTGGWSARVGIAWERIVFSGQPAGNSKRFATILGMTADNRTEAGTRGARFDLELDTGKIKTEPNVTKAEGRIAIVRMEGEASVPIGKTGQVRVCLDGGWIAGPDSIPRPQALGVGGSASLRGYGERELLAKRFGVLRLETGFRTLPSGNRLYGFVDSALLRPWPAGANRRKLGYGIGVRVRGAGGWARLDYGIAQGEAVLSGRIHFRLETRF